MTMDVLRYAGAPDKEKKRVQYYFDYITQYNHPTQVRYRDGSTGCLWVGRSYRMPQLVASTPQISWFNPHSSCRL